MGNKKNQEKSQQQVRIKPTITVYRDNTHVRDLVQLGFAPGTITDSVHIVDQGDSESENFTTDTAGNLNAKGSIPVLTSAEAGVNHQRNKQKNSQKTSKNSTERRYVHTEAATVQIIVEGLRQAKELRTIENLQNARNVKVGDFVEFQASFRPNEVSTLLDIFTPQAAGRLAKSISRSHYLKAFKESSTFPSYEEQQKLTNLQEAREQWQSDLAEMIVQGLQDDLRSTATREYHAKVLGTGEPLTAVIACEANAFITADPDRLLDGEFKVFGKVISRARENVSIFDRSKILARVQSGALNPISQMLEEYAKTETTGISGETVTLNDLFDMRFPSQIEGLSFGVLPVAIYV